MKQNKQSDFIRSCYIEHHSSGIVSILFTLKERWLPYGKMDDLTYWFSDKNRDVIKVSLSAEEFKLKKLEKDHFYMCYHSQEKDQVEYIYVPSNLLENI